MKYLMSALFIFCTTFGVMPLEASTYHDMSIEGSEITISALAPEGFTQDHDTQMDLLFHEEGKGVGFHYFYGPNFSCADGDNVTDYANWIADGLTGSYVHSEKTIEWNESYAVFKQITTDIDGHRKYYFICIDKIADELVFSVAGVSDTSLDDAFNCCMDFLDGIYWTREVL